MRASSLAAALAVCLWAAAGSVAPATAAATPAAGGARTTIASTTPARAAQTTASPTSAVAQAARTLKSDPVFVAPRSTAGISARDADRIRAAIRAAGGRIMVAVFAPGTGEPAPLGRSLAAQLRREGVFAIVAGADGRSFLGGQTVAGSGLNPNVARKQGTAAARERSPDVAAVVLDFVHRVSAARRNGGTAPGGPSPIWIFAVPAVLIVAGALLWWSVRRRRRQRAVEADELRRVADEDVVALGRDLRALDLDIELPDLDPRAKEQYARALQAYEQGNDAVKRAVAPDDFRPIGQTLEEGRYALEAAKARLEGREPPEHRPPCFFDPRHGPSAQDVQWDPAFGAPRLVPVCEADAGRIRRGQQPEVRQVALAGRGPVPFWQAPAYYGPYAGGFYAGFGDSGLLTGLLAGSALGGGWDGQGTRASGDGGNGSAGGRGGEA